MSAIRPWDFSIPNETIRDRRNPRSFDPDAHTDHANTETDRAMVRWFDSRFVHGHRRGLLQIVGPPEAISDPVR
jgi:hypothetical protein